VASIFDKDEEMKQKEELVSEIFEDAYDKNLPSFIMSQSSKKGQEHDNQSSDDDEPLTREVLPVFKDPKVKPSLWSMIKDSIGKDMT